MADQSRLRPKPEMHEYFMRIAMAVRSRADCIGHRVGAVLVLNRRIISTGYNGTPENMTNCTQGGCHRCEHRETYRSGTGYDLCICVHAEQNALLAAARFGIPVEGAVLYTTLRPCFGCTKELLQAQVREVYFLHDWEHPHLDEQAQYELVQGRFPGGIRPLDIADPDKEWALSPKPITSIGPADQHGHTTL